VSRAPPPPPPGEVIADENEEGEEKRDSASVSSSMPIIRHKRRGEDIADDEAGSECDDVGTDTIGGGDATLRNTTRRRNEQRLRRQQRQDGDGSSQQQRITGSTLNDSGGDDPYRGMNVEFEDEKSRDDNDNHRRPSRGNVAREAARSDHADSAAGFGRQRTITRMGMADISLPRSPVELGRVVTRQLRRPNAISTTHRPQQRHRLSSTLDYQLYF